MTKIVHLTTAAGPDGVVPEGTVRNVSKAEAKELIDNGYAREITASEDASSGPSENASRRRGQQQTVSGDESE